MASHKLKVLFLCTGNSCRSQMAEGWARRLKGDVIEPYSAGVRPQELNPRAVRVMAEAGVDISSQYSKTPDQFDGVKFDYVITLCDRARKVCPIFAGEHKSIHREFDDPFDLAMDARSEEEALDHYRRIRDELRAFVEQMPEVLLAAP